MRIPCAYANWKMHKTLSEALEFIYKFVPAFFGKMDEKSVSVAIFPPSPYIWSMREELGDESPIFIGGQDIYTEPEGAFTGAVSGKILKSAGASHVLIGHSERRHVMGEDNATVAKKLAQALKVRLIPVLCVGETLRERETGKTKEIVQDQLSTAWEGHEVTGGALIAYEPVWAIGTGKNAEPGDAQEMCSWIRNRIASRFTKETAAAVRILYGGSVSSKNIAQYVKLPDVDGALVGGASLDADEFLQISRAIAESGKGG
ncbi:MAG: triose-phosphate isomerase [bacterium]